MTALKKPHHRRTNARRFGFRRFSAIELLISLVLFFVATPFVEDSQYGSLLETVLLTCVLVSACLAVGGKRDVLIAGLVILIPTLMAKWSHHLFPGLLPSNVYLWFGLFFMGFVSIHLLRFILKAGRVNSEVLCAGVSLYLMIGLLWAMAYMLAGDLSPHSFAFANDQEKVRTMTGFNAFYFSFTTLSTVGFGDIAPISKVARTLALTEAITGMFYVAILISRLVALYVPEAVALESENDKDS